MKYVKTYELFGMFRRAPYKTIPDEMVQDISDILIGLEDIGYSTSPGLNTGFRSPLIKNHKKAREEVISFDIIPLNKDNAGNFDELSDMVSRIGDYVKLKDMEIEVKIWHVYEDDGRVGDVDVINDPHYTEIEENLLRVEELEEVSIIIAPTREGLKTMSGTGDSGPR